MKFEIKSQDHTEKQAVRLVLVQNNHYLTV